MIKRSRRRTPPPSTDRALEVHVGMARARQWQRRLWLASACACAASLLLWLVGASLPVHLGVVAAAFGLGLALPVRSARDWALTWVSGHGLSYPTALELGQGASAADPYGFHAAVAQRASLQASRLEPPKQQPWWLPLLVTALVLALLPVGPFGSRGSAPFASTRQNAANPTENAQNATAAVEPEAALEAPQTLAPTPAAEARNAAAAPTLDDLSAAGGAEAGAEGGSASDAEALNRFLDTLRDRPPPREEQTNPFSSAAPTQRPGSPGERSESGDAQEAPRSADAGDAAQTGEGQDGEPGETQSGAGEQSQGEQSQGEQGQGEQGQGEQGQGEQGQGDETGQAEAQGEQGQPGQQDGAGEGEAPNAKAADAEGSAAPQDGAPGDEAGRPEAGESGEGAGNTPGGLALGEDSSLATPDQEPEQLRGRLNSGPSNVAGTVRLPGTPPTSQAPVGSAPAGFSRAEERAVTEGRIPVEYQDIIRNYFR